MSLHVPFHTQICASSVPDLQVDQTSHALTKLSQHLKDISQAEADRCAAAQSELVRYQTLLEEVNEKRQLSQDLIEVRW